MKDNYIRIRLSDKDKELIREMSEKNQMTMTEYLVSLVRKEKIIEEMKKKA